MDFYTHRLVNYKSDAQDYTMQERIYYMYNSVVAQKEARIEDLKESYKNSLAYGALTNRTVGTHAHLNVTSSVYAELLGQERAALESMQKLSPTQYAFSLVSQESEQLEGYIDEKVELFDKVKTKCTKYEKNQGFGPMLSSLFGTREEKAQSLREEVVSLVEDITMGQDSLETWDGLSYEDKLEYVVGRYESEGLTSFDAQGFERFTRHISEINRFESTFSTQTPPPAEQ